MICSRRLDRACNVKNDDAMSSEKISTEEHTTSEVARQEHGERELREPSESTRNRDAGRRR